MLSTKLKEAAGNGADATLYVDDVFSTYLYTGDGGYQVINNGIDLAGKGGLVWMKGRSGTYGAYNHSLHDTQRGLVYRLSTNNTDAQSNAPSDINSFNSNGFTLGGGALTNDPSTTYASWTFRKAAKFFDVVTYTGDGSASRNIAHSLGIAPGMIIVKCTSASTNWAVYHRGLNGGVNPQDYAIYLNLTNDGTGGGRWANTAPTSTQFTVNNDNSVNLNGSTYVAYLFAHDTSSTGIIQCGSYTTDASAIGTNVNLGWQPQLVLVKSATSTSQWNIMDTMRGFTASEDNYLYPNLANAEVSGGPIAVNATGFKDGGQIAVSSTIIYMAIRMPNKPPTTGTQVYNADTRGSATATANNTSYYSGFPVDLSIGRNINYAGGDTQAFDRLRGNPSLWTNLTNAESAQTYYFDSNKGFYGYTQTANTDQLYWMFKRAPGFFDVVCYTSSSGSPEAHNLGVVPELIISKVRNLNGQNWFVNSPPLMTTYGKLNLADAWAGDATPYSATATTFNPISYGSTKNMVSYLFATLAGISKVGSYTGNGTGQAIACGFSAGARFVLIKRTDSTGGWYTFDSVRGLTSGSSPYLLLNSQDAQVTGNNGVYQSTGGFTLGSTASTTTNINAATYIFLAVA